MSKIIKHTNCPICEYGILEISYPESKTPIDSEIELTAQSCDCELTRKDICNKLRKTLQYLEEEQEEMEKQEFIDEQIKNEEVN